MDDQPIVRFVGQRERHISDCSISAFAMAFGLTYSEALVTIAHVAPKVLSEGADWHQLQRAAKTRGAVLREHKTFDLDDFEQSGGILGVKFPPSVEHGVEHAVYFKRGMVFDGQSESVWDADVYMRVNEVKALTMLVRTR